MSLTKFESEIKHLNTSAEAAYERCADLRHLEGLKERLNDPAVQSAMAGQVTEDKMADVRKYVNDITFDRDSLQLASPVGQLTLRIVERDPKCIKFASEGAPIQLYVWVQLLPETASTAKMKVTVGAEVNLFMKGMVSKPLRQATDGLANILQLALQAPTQTDEAAPQAQ